MWQMPGAPPWPWKADVLLVLILRTQKRDAKKRHHLSSCGDPASVFSPQLAHSVIDVVVVVVFHKGK